MNYEQEELDDILLHFGIKGMKWGVRRDQRKATGRARIERSRDRNEAELGNAIDRVKSEKAKTASKQFSNDPGYFERRKISSAKRKIRNLDQTEAELQKKLNTAKTMRSAKDNSRTMNNKEAMRKAIKDNPSKESYKLSLAHKILMKESIDALLAQDYDTYEKIIQMDIDEEARHINPPKVKHSEELDDILLHFGIKGMKWGVRRDQRKAKMLKKAETQLGRKVKSNDFSDGKITNRKIKKVKSYDDREQRYNKVKKKGDPIFAFVDSGLSKRRVNNIIKKATKHPNKSIATMHQKERGKAKLTNNVAMTVATVVVYKHLRRRGIVF